MENTNNVSNSPTPESNSSPEVNTSEVNEIDSSNSTPEVKQPKVKKNKSKANFADRKAQIEAKHAAGEEFTAEDLAFHEEWQAEEAKRVAAEKAKVNGMPTVADEEVAQAEGEEVSEESTDETTEEDQEAYAVPEDHAEVYKLTGAKNPQDLAVSIARNLDRVQQAIEYKQATETRIQEMESTHETHLQNAVSLLEAVVHGDQEAIEAAKALLVKAGKNPHKDREINREDYLTEAEYNNAVRTQQELAAIKNERELEKIEAQKKANDAKATQLKHEILTEVSAFAESAKDLGLTPAQARAVFNELEEKGLKAKLPPMAQKFKAVYEIAVTRGLPFEDAYAIYRHKNLPTIIKEEVAKLTNPKLKPSKTTSHITPKAPAIPNGKYTRDDVQRMIAQDSYPEEWTVTLSDGTKQLNPNAIPPYLANFF